MNKIMKLLMGLGLLAAMTAVVCGRPPLTNYTAALNAAQSVPMSSSNARGHCRAWVVPPDYPEPEPYGNHLEMECDFSGLSGPLTGAEIWQSSVGQTGSNLCDGWFDAWTSLPNNGTGRLTMKCARIAWDSYYFELDPLYQKGMSIVLKTANFPNGEIRGQIKPAALDKDINGEGRSEVSIFRPSDGNVYSQCGLTNSVITRQLGWRQASDSDPFPGDFDGDGITEWAFIRNSADIMIWFYIRSSDNELNTYGMGRVSLGDIPVRGDFNGDGTTNIGVFRDSTATWFVYPHWGLHWGQPGDKPCPADYDGDGTTDLCLIRPENGKNVWYIRRSTDRQIEGWQWGLATDTVFYNDPVDVDADGHNDLLVARDENGKRVFYALRSSDRSMMVLQWGLETDAVKLGDYDGDGKTDFAAVREVDNHLLWYIRQSSDGAMRAQYWGVPGDK